MQQPISQQHDQMGAQQAISQQMVLCPVRFVYETQILVQPGDQIQPNQTFFINPQNPPPWMQNSLQTRQPISNPVVYVQQLPNSLMPSVQQPMDQNQLYLQQNFANFQLQQQMLAQSSQDMRPTMQITNIVPNIVQNIQTSAPNERAVSQINQNNQIIQNQIQRPVQNQMVNQAVEVQRQVYMRPQIQQQANIQRPMIMNQMQNIQQQSLVNIPNVNQQVGQSFVPNMARPVTNMRTSVANNVVNVQPVAKIRELNPTEMNKPIGNPIGNVVPTVRNFVPNNYYRPIQPRPQINHNMPKVQHIPVQTIPNQPVYSDKPTQSTSNNHAIIQQLNNPINKKRKSESPDEIQKKMASNVVLKQNYPTQNITMTKLVSEIGTNTSPVHRPKVNIAVDTNSVKIIELKENVTKETIEKEKLIRNTVYPQARGRVLQDKMDETKPIVENIQQVKILDDKAVKTNQNIVEKVKEEKVIANKNVPERPRLIEDRLKTDAHSIEINYKTAHPPKSVQKEKYTAEKTVSDIKDKTVTAKTVETINDKTVETVNDKTVETVNDKTVETVNDTGTVNDKKLDDNEELKESNKISIKQENINILTHVVDGYVIQESNFAFPIRKPLKEKTIQLNQKSKENEKRDLVRESIKEELKTNLDIPLLPFHYLLLDSGREEKIKEEEKEIVEDEPKDNNPFARLQHTTVKSWTVEDLSSHLLNYSWKETVSLLQEHEIDGETLYLVSKPQLLTIGVAEEHADVICEFVKS